MTNEAIVNRLAVIGSEEAKLMRSLARLQTERCRLLSKGCKDNAALLGLSEDIDPDVIEPKDLDGDGRP